MAVFKCKMCGGTIEFNQGDTVGVCDSCGTKQSLPVGLDDEKRANLYDRANHFRRNNEYDKAMSIYEQILNEDSKDAEAYWSIILCRYGIEYVEDPTTHTRVPTVNRVQFSSVVSDKDYKSALKYGTVEQKEIYKAEARKIDKIQKGILEISLKEKPFDIFICYKETDNSGRRTPDSVLANDLYHQLTQEGYKVFFSRITLEDKLGQEYEPYIFAALNSAKVMVVLGTKPEYFNAVWVRNEWSRYLTLIKNGEKKMLIPAYKDMDPYDLPEEFSHLQAQDMSKLGFMQDLIRGINKIITKDEPKETIKETVVVNANNSNVMPLLERVSIFLEDGKWNDANIYCEKVLDIDPKNAQAYLGKLMAELRVKSRKQLADCAQPFDNLDNYGKVIRFGDEKLENEIRGYISHIKERNENNRLTEIYSNAINAMNSVETEADFKSAAHAFQSIADFKDSKEKAKECLEKAEAARKDAVLADGKSKMTEEDAQAYKNAISIFKTIPDWKNSAELILQCEQKIEAIKAQEESDRLEAERKAEERRIEKEKTKKKYIRIAKIGAPILTVVIVFIIILNTVIIPKQRYNHLVEQYGKESADKLVKIDVGDTYTFGTYEQDNNFSNGKEAIEWIVLAKDGNELLLISDKALDCQPYNKSWGDVTWETCSLRKWLNQDFLDVAFSESEKDKISTVAVPATNNQKYHTNAGNSTRDKVFILNIDEAKKYFETDESRRCAPTDYAVAQGASMDNFYTTYGQEATTCWLLRSPGESQEKATSVTFAGSIAFSGNSGDDGVRPAIWISF